MQCLVRTQHLGQRLTCGVSSLARVRPCELLTTGIPLGMSGVGPASTSAKGDGDSLKKAEWRVATGETKGQGLLEVLAAASASSSAGDDSTSKGEEGLPGRPLTVNFRGLSGQGLDCRPCPWAWEAASNRCCHGARCLRVTLQGLLACSFR